MWKRDRLEHNTRNLLAPIDDLEERGVGFRSLAEGITTRGPMGRARLTVMAGFAQLDRDQLAECTRADMEAARRNRRMPGQLPVPAADSRTVRAHQLKE